MVLAVACGGGAPEPAPRATLPVETPATAAAGGKTGVASIDVAIAAVLSGDDAALLNLVRYTPTPCEANPQGIGAPPVCKTGEAPGAAVNVFPMAQCEGFYVRPADLQLPVPPSLRLYGAYRAAQGLFPAGKYAVIFERSTPEAGATAWELVLSDAGVVGVHLGCAMTPPQMVAFQGLTDAIIAPAAPPGGGASPTSAP
jgi:hypothetical protein